MDQAEPALLDELRPERRRHALGRLHQRPTDGGRELVLEELPGRAAEQLLLFAESVIHGLSLWVLALRKTEHALARRRGARRSPPSLPPFRLHRRSRRLNHACPCPASVNHAL